MKKPSLLLLPLIVLFIFSCSTQESNEEILSDLTTTISTKYDEDSCSAYDPPFNKEGFVPMKVYTITYSPFISIEQIACIRKEYFEMFPCLFMSQIQDPNPYIDSWDLFPCWPNGDEEVDEAIDEDDRLGD